MVFVLKKLVLQNFRISAKLHWKSVVLGKIVVFDSHTRSKFENSLNFLVSWCSEQISRCGEVEFGNWLSNTTQKFENSLGLVNFQIFPWCLSQIPNSTYPQRDVCYSRFPFCLDFLLAMFSIDVLRRAPSPCWRDQQNLEWSEQKCKLETVVWSKIEVFQNWCVKATYVYLRRLYSYILRWETSLCKTPHFQWIYGKLNQIYEKLRSD